MLQTKEKEIDALKQISDKEIDSMSDAERLRAETERKLIESQTDPRNLIINNPNLSPQEKKDALALYDKTFGAERKAKLIKYSVIGAIALGNICLVMILVLLAPSALAASIYSLFFIDNIEPLNILAKYAHPRTPMAIKIFTIPEPSMVIIAIAPSI